MFMLLLVNCIDNTDKYMQLKNVYVVVKNCC